MPLLEGKCLSERVQHLELSCQPWGGGMTQGRCEKTEALGGLHSATTARAAVTESLILGRSQASQGTLGWWLCWESRPRQGSLTQDCMHREVQGKKKPKRRHNVLVLQKCLQKVMTNLLGCFSCMHGGKNCTWKGVYWYMDIYEFPKR